MIPLIFQWELLFNNINAENSDKLQLDLSNGPINIHAKEIYILLVG